MVTSVSKTFARTSCSSLVSIGAGLGRGDGVRHGHHQRPALRHLLLDRLLFGRERLDLVLIAPPPSRTRRAGSRVSRRVRGASSKCSVSPLARAASMPRSTHRRASSIRRACQAALRGKEDRRHGASRLFLRLEDVDGGFGLAQGGRRRCAAIRCPCASRSRISPSRDRSRVHSLVLEVVERDLRDADRLLGVERVERLARELQPVLDRLLGIVGLREMVHELGVDALEPAGVALFDQLGVLAVERPALAAGEGGVENVPDDAARKGQPVAARLPFLLEDPLAQQPVDGVVEIRGPFGQGLEVPGVEGLAEHRGDREKIAQLLRKPLDALLDGLLDRCRQGVRRDLRLLRKAPGSGVVSRDPARFDQGADQLFREEGVAFRRLAEPPGELVGDFRRSDQGLDQRRGARKGRTGRA